MINTYFKQQIKQNFGFLPTFEQENVMDSLSDFLFSRSNGGIFVLQGYAGTGKTSLVGALVKTLTELKHPVVLLAPTGRAAKVFSLYADAAAYTIHRRIYREKSFDGIGKFDLNFNKTKNAVFIVDEASMISNAGLAGAVFGTGRLLDDLISFVFQNEGCRLILLGDTAQLPPVGQNESPALSVEVLRRYGMPVNVCELTQIVRQHEDSGILYNATQIRMLLQSDEVYDFPKVRFSGFSDVHRVMGNDLIETLSTSYSRVGHDETMVICRSNKRSNIYNNGIRNQILDREDLLCAGDRVMIAKNNYFWTENIKEIDFIANGDMAVIRRVHHVRECYGFNFADVVLQFPDYNDLELDVTVLLDTLQSEAPSLSQEENEILYNKVMEDYEDIPLKPDRIKSIRKNLYYNALQIKYAYAVTCHKSQGGQWEHVYVDQGYMPIENLTSDYFHWLYTAFTRATQQLYLVNWPKEQIEKEKV